MGIREARENLRKESMERRQEESREFLKEEVRTRLQTSFIFPISEMEREFADLLNSDPNFNRKFRKIRKNILDTGNNQIRELNKIIDSCEVNWVGETLEMRKEQ